MKLFPFAALLLTAAIPACAPPAAPAAPDGAIVGSITPRFNDLSGWLVSTVEQAPDSLYSYKPNPEVRSTSEILGHVANAHYLFCAAALGEEQPEHPDYEKATDKATLLAGMNESVAYCERAYQISDADAMQTTQFFGSTMTRLAVLTWNATHDGEHYGNLVVYLRANGMVPPSSQGGN